MTYYHVSGSVRAFVEMGQKKFTQVYGDTAFTEDDGTALTSNQAFDGLLDMLKDGREVILSKGCDHFDKTGCLGHEEEKA